ncbi:MAG: TRAP transporter small permease [Ahrensia sp.]|nr:TRAP transporter small permease [Ahrensia sp.]
MVEHEKSGPVDWLNWTFSRVMMWAPAFIVSIIFYEVFMRYILFRPTLWVNEMSLWIGGAIYVTAGLYAMQQRSHIRIFIIYDMAPRWLRKVFDTMSAICVCIFAMAVIYGGFGEAAAKFWRWETFGTAFDPPIPATNKPLILATLLVLGLQALSNLIRDWPAAAFVRKTFDVLAAALLVGLLIWGLPILFSEFTDVEGSLKMPLKWRIGVGAIMVASIIIVIYGLIKDFNKTPAEHVEVDEIEEEAAFLREQNAPDEVLTGRPPKVDAASGKIEGDR